MKEKPILFSTPMVQAILQGRKTQTRRILKPRSQEDYALMINMEAGIDIERCKEELIRCSCPYGHTGDHLWVRETFYAGYVLDENDSIPDSAPLEYWYFADTRDQRPGDMSDSKCYHLWGDDKKCWPRWRPSIHMPKAAARIWLEVESIKIERVQDISEQDAKSEGVTLSEKGTCYLNYLDQKSGLTQFIFNCHTAKDSYKTLWNLINTDIGMTWRDNPWVWVVSFKVLSTTGRSSEK